MCFYQCLRVRGSPLSRKMGGARTNCEPAHKKSIFPCPSLSGSIWPRDRNLISKWLSNHLQMTSKWSVSFSSSISSSSSSSPSSSSYFSSSSFSSSFASFNLISKCLRNHPTMIPRWYPKWSPKHPHPIILSNSSKTESPNHRISESPNFLLSLLYSLSLLGALHNVCQAKIEAQTLFGVSRWGHGNTSRRNE